MRIRVFTLGNVLVKPLRVLAASGLLFALVGAGYAKPEAKESEPASEVTIWVDDIHAIGNFNAEDLREDLLREAFMDAARREKWLGDYDFEYNGSSREPGEVGVELRVVDWRRSPTGMYQFSVVADYWNADGEKLSLGTFHGMRTSIVVLNRWDVGEQFVGSAEDAFRDALRTLKKRTIES